MLGEPEAFAMLRRSSRAGGNPGMLRNRKSLGFVILVLIGLAYIVWVISGSQTFQSCFHDREHASAYIALFSDDILTTSILRVRLNSECILSVLINHGGAITAISSAMTAIAIFLLLSIHMLSLTRSAPCEILLTSSKRISSNTLGWAERLPLPPRNPLMLQRKL
jgi:hypothetical protein